ncbi:MAG: ATP-dependent DNA helicase RecG, partial [Dehalococcoidia bacterium]|nr:ATP-dependent DNA helicase RecG [Dehalococcoidia bacterium]
GERLFESPEWDLIEERDLVHAGRLVPVYPLTRGLYPRQMRNLMKRVVDVWAWQEPEFLPEELRKRRRLLGISEALRQAHFPDSQELCARARERLAFDELLVLQLGVLAKKKEWQEGGEGRALQGGSGAVKSFVGSLPFPLTSAQQHAMQDIMTDIGRSRPMSRLLQGDVGSGKTVVATAALVVTVDSGFQGALMAPTQILAEQHFKTLSRLLHVAGPANPGNADGVVSDDDGITEHAGLLPRPIRVALLTGSTSERRKGKLYQRIEAGEVDIVVGTHALIQKGVRFERLALVVVDEQHRFGVTQRAALRQKGFNPHLLVMTATPIPRTLALTLFGDLEITTINEMPPGRQRVKTRWLWPDQRSKAYEFVRRQVGEGHQAFVICPLVEESEVIEAKAAVSEFERLSGEVFPELKLGLLHGRMKGKEKEEVMRQFNAREFDILVSTSVVEVGIDVPNATVMLVEGADRFGLSQLHQFRGRVGRGPAQSYCILLSENPSPEGRERLALIERTYDGFLLAEEDMKLRGPGEFFGTRQSGLPDLRMARLTDVSILETAREDAVGLFEKDPALKGNEFSPLRARMARVWKHDTEVS